MVEELLEVNVMFAVVENAHRILYCPVCKVPLEGLRLAYKCHTCGRSYPVLDGIPSFVDEAGGAKGFDVSAFELLFEMERTHFGHIGRKELILDVLQQHVLNLGQSSMLEIGCGNGNILAYLKQNEVSVEGSDIFVEALTFCRRRVANVPLYQIDVLSLPFREEFDVIGVFDVLEHIDDEKALAQISQALKPKGMIFVTVPAQRFLWSHFYESSNHKRRYGKNDLAKKLERNGFIIRRISFFMFFLFPLVAAVRIVKNPFRQKAARSLTEASVELKTIPIANGLFLGMLRLERRLMRHLDLPFRSSLLVVAEKR